ncbi:MAG TPA: FMN-binding negative transcriptional regulator [Arthrobacter sp.]|nr:FMN-binding negative transcriptional regulator [Arthrobacter sp.]
MYIPSHFAVDQEAITELLSNHGAANLVTSTERGLLATLLPFVYDPEAGGQGALLGHVARNNEQWLEPALGESLAILQRSDAYISPSWYPSKAQHGRVVPTWNYTTAHVYGRLVIHDDPAWVGDLVRRLTTLHEASSERPWSVDDAPARFVAGQLRAIVGVELVITRVEAKRKLSQNRPAADVDGVIAGLRAKGELAAADDIERAQPAPDRRG